MEGEDLIAQFCAVTGSEVDTATQYLSAADFNLESAVELFFASEGATAGAQSSAFDQGPQETGVRERIERRTDRLVDPEEEFGGPMSPFSYLPRREVPSGPRTIFNQSRDTGLTDNLSTHERRLAELFRPPFDLISDLDMDAAKELAQAEKKWIMVNVQDTTDFGCQRMNRDLWRHESVKAVVKENFVFLQYDVDSTEGESYRLLYPFEKFPHVAILDPWAGERVKQWARVPEVENFLEEVIDFLGQPQEGQGSAAFAGPGGQRRFSPPPGAVANVSDSESDMSHYEVASEISNTDPTAAIEPKDVPEPPAGNEVTRIQIRLGDGKRIVRRFNISDTVQDICAVIKHLVPSLQGQAISLMSGRTNVATALSSTILEANLKNSVIMVELQ